MSDYHFLYYLLNEVMPYGMAGGAGYLAWRLVRAYERRGAATMTVVSELRGRVKLLEDVVERIDESLGQTVEAQQFTTRLLMSRAVSIDERTTSSPGVHR
jgi:hypothetical protein